MICRMRDNQFQTRDQPCIGVSRCLLGDAVRYDGGHKKQDWLVTDLVPHVEVLPVCPEVLIGLGVPRPPLRLVQGVDGIRARGVADPQLDVTEAMQQFARQLLAEQRALDGWIFKSRSPSCGVSDVPVFHPDSNTLATGQGLFAEALMKALPLMPVADELELYDPSQRDSFIERLFVYRRYRRWFANGLTLERLQGFHCGLRGHLLARDEQVWARLDRVVAQGHDPGQDIPAYLQQVMKILTRPVTRGGLAQALLACGEEAPGGDKDIATGIHAYLAGRVDLQTVVRQWQGKPDLEPCFLLDPEPAEITLRYGAATMP